MAGLKLAFAERGQKIRTLGVRLVGQQAAERVSSIAVLLAGELCEREMFANGQVVGRQNARLAEHINRFSAAARLHEQLPHRIAYDRAMLEVNDLLLQQRQ